jgi:two-component system chemotaxis sensor kinase CheA
MVSKIYAEDRKAIIVFANECIGVLDEVEKGIPQPELSAEDLCWYDQIYRLIHKIKLGSSFFGLSGLTRITYEIEFLLKMIQMQKDIPKRKHLDQLLSCVEFLNTYIKRLYHTLQEYSLSNEGDAKDIEFETSFEDEQILERLELNHSSNAEGEKEEYRPEQALEKDCFDVMISESLSSHLTEDIRQQFLLENTEYFDMLENNLLIRLDNDHYDLEAVNEVFRVIHSMKGGAGVLLSVLLQDCHYYNDVKKFLDVVHNFEGLLSLIRDKKYNFSKNHVDLSLKVIDYLKSLVRAVELNEVQVRKDEIDHRILELIKQEVQDIQRSPMDTGQNNGRVTDSEGRKAEDTKPISSVTQSIRVRQDKIDNLMNLISELIIAKNSFPHISNKLSIEYHLPELSKEVKQVGANVNRISDELQNSIMSIRMVEVRTVFQKMIRTVRDIAKSSDKMIELMMEGEDTEIDKSIIELISDPLVHIIRNSADHGIEAPRERLEKNKPEIGRIILRAYNKSNYVFIEVEDDGKGINPETIKRKAIEKGIITELDAERMNHNQLINLIFLPGFSMAERVTEVSGRGVGMDIVRSNIAKINGTITVESEPEKGTKMTIRLPLSLAVSQGLIVEVYGEHFIIPLDNIVETVKIKTKNIHKFNDKYFTYLRENVIGLEWLSKLFLLGERDREKDKLNAVIVTDGIENFALIVDRLKNEQEFVMKPLDGHLSAIPGISGSTLLGNGKVVLIVNPMDLMKLAGL